MRNTNAEPSGPKLEVLRRRVADLIANFEAELRSSDLRSKVLALVPVFQSLRSLGRALILKQDASAARDRILYYFRKYPGTVISGDELLVVSGIQEYARRLRELRVQFGWKIASGATIKEMSEDAAIEVPEAYSKMKTSDYILLNNNEDRDAAHRWNVANAVRKEPGSMRDKILSYLRQNVGRPVTNEELRYVAGNKTEWARRVRELRTEQGWPIVTKTTGLPELDVGTYVLQADRQSPKHDRNIPDEVRRETLRRDNYKCQNCGWSKEIWNESDPRHLELHHIEHHSEGGPNVKDNLKTLCNICHDAEHKARRGPAKSK